MKTLLTIIIFLCSIIHLNSQNLNSLQWSGSSSISYQAEHILEVSNGNYLVCGSNDVGKFGEGCIVLLDNAGNEINKRILPNITSAIHAVENNGSFYVVGNDESNGWIYQLSLSSLQILSQRSYFECYNTDPTIPIICDNQVIGKNALLVSGTGIIVAGQFSQGGAIIRRYNSNLGIDESFEQVIQNIAISNIWGEEVIDIERMADGDILFLGSIQEVDGNRCNCPKGIGKSVSGSEKDFWGLRITVQGVLESNQRFGSRGNDFFIDAVATPDNGFALLGYTCDDGYNVCNDNRIQAPVNGSDYIWKFNNNYVPENGQILGINAGVVIPIEATYIQYSDFSNTYFVTGYYNDSYLNRVATLQQINAQLFPVQLVSKDCDSSEYNCCIVSGSCAIAVGSCITSWGQLTFLENRKIWDAYGDCNGNNICESARPLNCNDSEFFGTFNEPREINSYCNGQFTTLDLGEVVYEVNITEPNETYTFQLTGINSSTDLDMFLLASCDVNDCIDSSDGSSSTSADIIEVQLSAGTYFLIVDTDGPIESNYTISMTCQKDCIDLSLRDECFIIYPLVNNQYSVNFNYNIPEAQGAQNIIWESQGNTIGGGDSVDFGMTPGATREICCYWEVDSGEVTRCYKLCKTICFPTNSDCDNIWFRPLDQFSGTNYEFSIQGTTEVLSWELHDDDGNIEFIDDDPDTEVVFSYTPAIGECLYVTATYRDSDGCIRICCRKFCFQELDCGRDVIEPVFTGNQQEVLNGQYRYRFNDLIPINAQVLKWKAYPLSLQSDVIETDPANPELLLTTLSETSQTTYRICCIYELGGCVRVCCIDICLNNPYQCGSSALVTCNYEDNTYDIQSFVSNVTVLYWTDDSGNRLSQYDGLADITYPISELPGQRFLYCYYQECLDVPFGEFPISSCWNSVCCIPLPDCNQDCYLSCCRDSDRTWLENLKVSYAQNCNSCPFNNENTIIRECTFQDQCYIEVERQNCDDGSGLVDWTYEYYTCDGQFYNPPLDAFPSCRVIWDCRTGEVPECPDCVEKCCDNDNTLDALIANANSFITIYQCDYLGQCVYDVRYNDPSLIDEENGSIYNCQGALIGSYSFFNPAALENLQNCRPIWNYYYGKVEACDDSECNNPVSEVCEDFNNYTSNVGISSQSNNWFVLNNNQDCRVMGSNGAKYLWVERQGFDYCESAMRINENSGTDAIIELSFDITIPYYNFGSFPLQADGADIYIYEQDQNSQNYINIAFRPHSSDATNDDRRICLRITDKYESDGCFSGDGELFPYYRNSTNRVSITLDKSTGDVKVFINQDLLAEASNSGLSQLGMIGFSSIFNPVGGYRIDNICTQVCRDGNGGGGNTEPIICEIAEVCGGIGDRVRIPVRVKNFNNVAAFSLGLDLIRDIGDFTGVILANQQLINERLIFQGNSSSDGKFLEIIYATSGQRITLPDNTAILELEVEITNSNIGEAEIRGASQPDPLANVLDNNGNSSDTPIIIESGEVCYQETSVSLSGRIITEENVAIADVDVLLSGPVNDRDFTDSDGRYIFEDIQQGSQNRISPTLNSYVYEAINVSDLVVMIDHILSNNLITSHYKLIAADMNEDERISVTDLTMLIDVILRNPILGDPWIFVEEDFIFNNAEPSIEQDYPRDIFLSNIQNNNSNLDFIGIHKGDLNGSFNGIKNQNSRIPTKKSCLSFIINEKSLTQGEEKLVTITLDSFETLRTFSAELNIDLDQLEVLEVISDNSDLSNDLSIELNDLDKGYIKLLWFTLSSNGQSLPMGSELLTLRVKAKANTTLNQSIAVTSDLITSETVNAMNEEGCISLMFMTSTSIQDMVDSDKLTLYPSPWYDQTTLQFESYSYDDMTFTITTIDGKEVLSRKVSVVSGLNQIVINEESIDNHHGILIYHLQSEDKHYVGKMIKH